MLTLFFVPGTSSMAPHIMLHELGLDFESRPLTWNDAKTPAYLALNLEGKVPTLLADGKALTEVAAILYYLARRHPGAGLLPEGDPLLEAEVVSWMSFIASTLHPNSRLANEITRRLYGVADRRLGENSWAIGRYSIADIHLFRLYWRNRSRMKAEPGQFPSLERHYARMMERPAVKRTIEIESAIGYELPA